MGQEFAHFLDSLGWAVIHSLWQGIVALIAVVILRVALNGRLPALRHAGQFIALLACLAGFLWTFAAYLGQPLNIVEGGATPLTPIQTDTPSLLSGLMPPFDPSAIVTQSGFDPSRITPILACFWGLGFALLSLRYAFAFGQVQQLRTLGVSAPSADWQEKFARLLRQSGLPKNVKLLISSNVNGPMTLGLFKPIVLVPIGFLCGLPQDEVEAVLMHELAHIRRHDYALNLVQTAVKTVLFFHPAVHIIARWADQDREQACDDLAISQGRDPLALIRGLATLRLQSGPALTMTATGNGENTPLMTRLTRLAGQTPSRARPEYIVMSVLSMLLIGSVYLGSSSSANAHPVPEEYEHAKAEKHNYTFQTKRLNGRNVTVKVTEDGRRWVLADGAWTDIDKNPEVIGRLPTAMPQPPEPPAPENYKNGEFDGHAFNKKMKQFEIDIEYFEADMERYFDENKHLSEREQERIERDIERQVERAEREAERMEDRMEAEEDRIEAEMERAEEKRERIEEKAERQREQAAERRERAEEKPERARERAEQAEERKEKSDKRHAKYNDMRETLYGYLIKDGFISSRTEKATLHYVDDNWTVNGEVISSKKEGKYCSLFSNMNVKKSTLTKVEITPGSTHIVNESKSGKQSQHITFGEHKHENKSVHVHKGRHVHKDGKVHDPVPPAPPVQPQSYIHKTSAKLNTVTSDFSWPTKSRHITAKYGQVGKLWDKSHKGLDFKGNIGAPVFASADGIVHIVTTEPKWGNRIVLKHSDGFQTLYGHMNNMTVSRGQYVKAGDVIGGVGNTGKSTGPHLHFEIRKNGQTVDPAALLN